MKKKKKPQPNLSAEDREYEDWRGKRVIIIIAIAAVLLFIALWIYASHPPTDTFGR